MYNVKRYKGDKSPFSLVLLSFFVAFYVDLKAINWALVYGGFVGEGIMKLLYPTIIGFIFFFSFICGEKRHFSTQLVLLILYLFIYYFVTDFIFGPPEVDLNTYLAMVLVAIAIPAIASVDARWFLRAIIIWPSFAILRLDQVFAPEAEWYLSVSLDASYGFLIPVTGAIIYLYNYFKDDGWKMKLLMSLFCLINLIFLLQLMIRGSRGTIFCLIVLCLFLYIVRKKEQSLGVYLNKKRLRSFLFTVLAILIFTPLFYLLLDKLQTMIGIDIYAIQHMLEQASEGEISNGRFDISAITWNGIFDSPILGNGIDRFNANTQGLMYPHNFILQVLYDGGIILLLLLLFPVLNGTIKRYKICTYDEFTVFTFLLFCSVPGALFSISIYNNAALWVFFGSALVSNFVINRT